MGQTFNAILVDNRDGVTRGELARLSVADLPAEAVLIDVSHSTLNYKDALAVTGKGKIARKLPMVCGIDLAGTVSQSTDPGWKAGDRVLINGFGMSERYWGGYSQKARVKPEWLVRLPDRFSPEQAMAIGTAGYTAMLCVQAIEDHGVRPDDGPVLVTGASGGVGSIAIMLLSALGYEVVAMSGRLEDHGAFLSGLGASRLVDRADFAHDAKPLESETWAAVVDSAGGRVLAMALAQTRYEGIVAACGLAGGADLKTTVMPFILRGVTLRGIDSVMASQARRASAWNRLSTLVDATRLATIYSVAPMTRLPEYADGLLTGKIRGRLVIDVNA